MATKKEKRLSVNAFEEVFKGSYSPTVSFEWNGLEVVVKKLLGIQEFMEFVRDVVENCFPDGMTYTPEAKQLSIKFYVLERYANFTLPKNIESRYEMVYATDAFDEVIQRIDPVQLHELEIAIDEKIEYRIRANIESVTEQMRKAVDGIQEFEDKITDIFSGVEAKDIQKIVGAIGENGIDEKKLMDAYLDRQQENSQVSGNDSEREIIIKDISDGDE